jgi:ubiquinone/menaquinone biosynthesis C-methylase UbiE
MTDWSDPAAWYDVLNPWGPSDDFYLARVMASERVLDVGCGTGTLLRRARTDGHCGHLVGLDPDPKMLGRARRCDTIEWVLADAASAPWDQQFDLAVMASHAFQNFITDDELHRSLRAIQRCLVDGGRFTFETRHPQARAWEGWHGSYPVRNPDGEPATVSYEVLAVDADVVRLTETLTGQWWKRPHVEEGRLRFLDPDTLSRALTEAGFNVEHQYGGWEGNPITGTSEEIITVARRI